MNIAQAIVFINRAAEIAETEGQHPAWLTE